WLDFPRRPRSVPRENARHASPLHLHVGRVEGGADTLVVRLLALPARYLRNRAESVRMLREFANGFRHELSGRAPRRRASGVIPAERAVTVTVLERREAGGRVAFVVQEEGRPKGMLMYGKPPEQLPEVGAQVQV